MSPTQRGFIEASGSAHQSRQTSLRACWKLFANRGPSQRGDAAIRSRRPARSSASRGRSPASPTARSDVLREVARDRLGQADVREVAQRMAAGERLARAGHDRHAHPEGLAGRHAPGIGEGIEGHVDPIVVRQQVGVRRLCPAGPPAPARRPGPRTGPGNGPGWIRSPKPRYFRTSREPGTRRRISAQAATTSGRDLGRVVEAAEGHVSPLQRRQGADGGGVRRGVVAHVAVGQPDDLLAVDRSAPSGDVEAVGDQVVDRRQAGACPRSRPSSPGRAPACGRTASRRLPARWPSRSKRMSTRSARICSASAASAARAPRARCRRPPRIGPSARPSRRGRSSRRPRTGPGRGPRGTGSGRSRPGGTAGRARRSRGGAADRDRGRWGTAAGRPQGDRMALVPLGMDARQPGGGRAGG